MPMLLQVLPEYGVGVVRQSVYKACCFCHDGTHVVITVTTLAICCKACGLALHQLTRHPRTVLIGWKMTACAAER